MLPRISKKWSKVILAVVLIVLTVLFISDVKRRSNGEALKKERIHPKHIFR